MRLGHEVRLNETSFASRDDHMCNVIEHDRSYDIRLGTMTLKKEGKKSSKKGKTTNKATSHNDESKIMMQPGPTKECKQTKLEAGA